MKAFLLLLTMALVACSPRTDQTPTRPVEIDTQPLQRPKLNLPPIDQFNARVVDWVIVTPDNSNEIFTELERRGESLAIFGLSEKGYENVSLNIADLLTIVTQQQAVIDGYRSYYIAADGIIYQYNQSLTK